METAAAEEIEKVAFGTILLDDFLRCLENPAGFTTVTTSAAATINLKPLTKGGSLLLHRGGLLLRCQKQ